MYKHKFSRMPSSVPNVMLYRRHTNEPSQTTSSMRVNVSHNGIIPTYMYIYIHICVCMIHMNRRIDVHHSSDHGTDRRLSHTRDPLRRSRDTATSDPPSMAERGGHGRDGPVIARDPTATIGGGNVTRTGGAAVNERDRTCSGYKVGEEELPMEVPGRYEKMRVLGRGSFGAVTLVKDNRDSKLYAMKTLNCADKLEERVTAMAEVCARARVHEWQAEVVLGCCCCRVFVDC